jgi:hypothetical protein
MVIKLPFIARLKGHVQIMNLLLGASFRKIRAEDFTNIFSARITHQDLKSFGVF